MREIDKLFTRQAQASDAMAYHMPTIRKLAEKCSSAAEIGIRRGSSTIALLAGCKGNVYSFDIERLPAYHDPILEAAKGRWHPSYVPSEHGVLTEDVGMLVIDGYHNYSQVAMELERFAHKVEHYLVFHDTISCGLAGEGIANPSIHQPEHFKDKRGIRLAIDHFMAENHHWHIHSHDPEHSGLLVLERYPV